MNIIKLHTEFKANHEALYTAALKTNHLIKELKLVGIYNDNLFNLTNAIMHDYINCDDIIKEQIKEPIKEPKPQLEKLELLNKVQQLAKLDKLEHETELTELFNAEEKARVSDMSTNYSNDENDLAKLLHETEPTKLFKEYKKAHFSDIDTSDSNLNYDNYDSDKDINKDINNTLEELKTQDELYDIEAQRLEDIMNEKRKRMQNTIGYDCEVKNGVVILPDHVEQIEELDISTEPEPEQAGNFSDSKNTREPLSENTLKILKAPTITPLLTLTRRRQLELQEELYLQAKLNVKRALPAGTTEEVINEYIIKETDRLLNNWLKANKV